MKKLIFALLSWCGVAVALAAPAQVILRVPTGQPLPAGLPARLAEWRQSGEVSEVLLLTQGRSESGEYTAKFEAFAVLEFASEAACTKWQRTARATLPAGVTAREADVLVTGGHPPADAGKAVFVVNTYTPTTSRARYQEFAQGYIKPLYEAMTATGNLVRYTMYHERGEQGQVDALTVLTYRDAAALAALGTIKPAIREKLTATVPTYAQFDKIKDSLRTDGHGTTGTYTPVPAPK
jgi:hypothetical protein